MTEHSLDESTALDGPDYVALVIEWDQLADRIEGELVAEPTERIARPRNTGWIAAAIAIGVVALARWGIHRLRAA